MTCMLSLLLLSLAVATVSAGVCGVYAQGHTMCLPAGVCSAANPGPCGAVNQTSKAEIVALHNKYRQLVAEGKETRGRPGPQPAGTNIYALKWNDELAAVAQRWAEQMRKGHDCNTCRATATFPAVGQNIATTGSSASYSPANWGNAVKMWTDEVKDMSGVTLKGATGAVVGHYTQAVWASTREVGCGLYSSKTCTIGTYYGNCIVYVCNYGPAGNYIGQAPYNTTTRCRNYSSTYSRLCV